MHVLGIDIAKAKFDVALMVEGKFRTKVFEYSVEGLGSLKAWLTRYGVELGQLHMRPDYG